MPAIRTPGESTAGDLPGSPGHSSPAQGDGGGVSARPELSTRHGVPTAAPSLPSSGPWRRCNGGLFRSRLFASARCRNDATAGYLSSCACFVPGRPAALPPPGRREGSTALVGAGRTAPPGVISIPGMQCGQGRAGPAERDLSDPLRPWAGPGRAVVPVGAGAESGEAPEGVGSRERNRVGVAMSYGAAAGSRDVCGRL